MKTQKTKELRPTILREWKKEMKVKICEEFSSSTSFFFFKVVFFQRKTDDKLSPTGWLIYLLSLKYKKGIIE